MEERKRTYHYEVKFDISDLGKYFKKAKKRIDPSINTGIIYWPEKEIADIYKTSLEILKQENMDRLLDVINEINKIKNNWKSIERIYSFHLVNLFIRDKFRDFVEIFFHYFGIWDGAREIFKDFLYTLFYIEKIDTREKTTRSLDYILEITKFMLSDANKSLACKVNLYKGLINLLLEESDFLDPKLKNTYLEKIKTIKTEIDLWIYENRNDEVDKKLLWLIPPINMEPINAKDAKGVIFGLIY